MNKKEIKQKNISKSLRVKESTKVKVDKFVKKVNSSDEYGRICVDQIVNFLIDNVTKEDIEKLQFSTITWAHEDKRLKKLWEKKHGKVTENKWKELLYIGQLSEFIATNSRLQLVPNEQAS